MPLCQHVGNDAPKRLSSFRVRIKIRIGGDELNTIQQCVVTNNSLVLSKDSLLDEAYKSHKGNSIWWSVHVIQTFKKAKSKAALKA